MNGTPADSPPDESQLADFFAPPVIEEARVVSGRTYAFKVSDEEVNIAFGPDLRDLGGSRQTARLEGRLELFIEDLPKDGKDARIWIADIEENVHGLDVYGMQAFTLDTSMLNYGGFDFDNPMGSLDTETGEYNLTYVIEPRHPVLSELGLGEGLGTIAVREQGVINLDADGGATLRTSGSLSIEDGPFAGTGITYSPKGGTAPPVTEVTLWLSLPATGCGTYAGFSNDGRVITSNGVFAVVRSGDAGTVIGFRGTTRSYNATQWDRFWNGVGANGQWAMALINRGIPCSSFPTSATLNVKVRP